MRLYCSRAWIWGQDQPLAHGTAALLLARVDLGQYMGALRPGRKTPPVYEHEIVLQLPMQDVKLVRD